MLMLLSGGFVASTATIGLAEEVAASAARQRNG